MLQVSWSAKTTFKNSITKKSNHLYKFYRIVEKEASFFDAAKECQKHGGKLMTIGKSRFLSANDESLMENKYLHMKLFKGGPFRINAIILNHELMQIDYRGPYAYGTDYYNHGYLNRFEKIPPLTLMLTRFKRQLLDFFKPMSNICKYQHIEILFISYFLWLS